MKVKQEANATSNQSQENKRDTRFYVETHLGEKTQKHTAQFTISKNLTNTKR